MTTKQLQILKAINTHMITNGYVQKDPIHTKAYYPHPHNGPTILEFPHNNPNHIQARRTLLHLADPHLLGKIQTIILTGNDLQ